VTVLRKAVLSAAIVLAGAVSAAAEVDEVRLARQIDIAYVPLAIMEGENLIEKHAQQLGLEKLKVVWTHLRGGSSLNEVLLSGQVDYAAGGVPPMIVLWDRTRGNANVRGVAAINRQCFALNTNNPKITSIKDFSENDRIAVPSIKVSIQAIVLQMAAEQAFGEGKHNALDHLTVSMTHPDGAVALIAGKTEITGHFTTPPFMYQEQQSPNVRQILSSCDVFGANPTFSVLWTTDKFRTQNPKAYHAVLSALEDAVAQLSADPKRAAETYIKLSGSKLPLDFVLQMITDKQNKYDIAPERVTAYSDFMHKVGLIRNRPSSWKELFFPEIHDKSGS
jgi:NitT/TauT family transport system substrate-binding protein